ncbi:TPA: restriction endonuclease subunit S [Serratia marcescens]|nr:restriction endonuclease subunit S [Serratia marcescens]
MSGVAEVSSTYLAEMASNSIPVGYKQTEVGVIPEDWQLSNIRDVSAIPMQNGLFYEPKRKGKGVPLINVGDMYTAAPVDVDSLELFNATAGEIKVFRVERGDLFFTRSSVVPSGIAYCNIFDSEREDVVFDSHLIRVRPNTEILEPRYLYLNCIAKHSRTALIAEAKTATMTTIDQGAINRCPVLVPPKKEQTAIANALSDADALISELEKLIAKKQAIKTATMQQLLTGRTRLPQFALREDGTPKRTKPSELGEIPEDWEVVEFSSIVWFQEGPGVRQYQFTSSGIKLLNGTNIENGSLLLEKTQRFISEKLAYGQYSHFMIDAGDILIACSGVTIARFDEKVTVAGDGDLPLCLNTSTMRFKIRSDNTDKFFIKNFLKSSFFKDQIGGKATGSAQLNFGPYHVNQVKISVPNKKEQTAIATILSDMDAEIQALEQRLSKTRQIKQGMMKELLTGKTRLLQPLNKESQHG